MNRPVACPRRFRSSHPTGIRAAEYRRDELVARHLRVFSALADWGDPGSAFTAVTQLGTETAVLIYFRKDIASIVTAWSVSLVARERRKDPDARLGWFVIVGTVPIAALGLAFQDAIEFGLRGLRITAGSLISFGRVLAFADHTRAIRTAKLIKRVSLTQALGYGFAQSLVLMPGVSRSGGTISAGLLMGYSREAAARYSFLLAVPAVLASGGLELLKIREGLAPAWGPSLWATFIAFVSRYAVIAWFMKFISQSSFALFGTYRVALGLALLALVDSGVLAPGAGPTG